MLPTTAAVWSSLLLEIFGENISCCYAFYILHSSEHVALSIWKNISCCYSFYAEQKGLVSLKPTTKLILVNVEKNTQKIRKTLNSSGEFWWDRVNLITWVYLWASQTYSKHQRDCWIWFIWMEWCYSGWVDIIRQRGRERSKPCILWMVNKLINSLNIYM